MVRAGAYALTLLSVPLNVHVLTAVEKEPMSLTNLRQATGSPPQTTTRKQLRTLADLGVLERRQGPAFPGSVEYRLGEHGARLLDVARVVETWLSDAPEGRIELGTLAAKNAIKALVDGWDSTVVRALAARPLSLTQLSRLISSINYPALERRIAAMRLTGQVISCESNGGRSRPYSASAWLRRATGPLAAAAHWERQLDTRQATPVAPMDIESMFLLALPLVRGPEELQGSVRLTAELRRADGSVSLVGAKVRVEGGVVASCSSQLEGTADAWCSAPAGWWLRAAVTGEVKGLEIGGDGRLGYAVVSGLRPALLETDSSVHV